MKPYNPNAIEEKWLKHWQSKKLFQGTAATKPQDKYYALWAFAYPSGSGLHVGHVESLAALDILVRYLRMTGKDVFFPVGWDAFGLPAENYAIKTGIPPEKTTRDAITNFEGQVKRIGISMDWESELATCDSEYYKWTQWIFVKLFEAGLAYRDKSSVNWCPQDKTVLANEQVINGACDRCGSSVIQKDLEQWKFKITKYQDELIKGLEKVDWPQSTRDQQINWIGKSEGTSVKFNLGEDKILECFSTRLDTVFGVTFLVIAPEKFKEFGLEALVEEKRKSSVASYLDAASHKTEEQRRVGEKDKTGVDTGLFVAHPITGAQIPVWIADYVLAGYGTGVVMGVPAHDPRDHAFAMQHGLEIKPVIESENGEESQGLFSDYGKLINSGKYSDLSSKEAITKLIADYPQAFAKKTTYKLRDWLISRQRYWGAPIPMVFCESCAQEGKGANKQMLGWYAVAEAQLPVKLPQVPDFRPTDDGKSPIEKASESWKFTKCPGCGGQAKREVDTMDTFVDSSWYFLRYVDAHNDREFASKEKLKQWLPVDNYLIGAEHSVLHLLYSRFFVKFLHEQGYLSFDEPFLKMRHQGMILGPDNRKMSKSKGNVINPDDVIEKFGADTLRVYEMFMGPLDADKAWDTSAVNGVYRFMNRIYTLVQRNLELSKSGEIKTNEALRRQLHKTIVKVGKDISTYHFNTAVAALMEFSNSWSEAINKSEGLSQADLVSFTKIIAPLAPFLAEELFELVSQNKKSVHQHAWPEADSSLLVEAEVEIVVQVNAKVRTRFSIPSHESQDKEALKRLATAALKQAGIEITTGTQMIVVPGKLVNAVLK